MNRVNVQRYKESGGLEIRVGIGIGGARAEFNWSGGDCLSGRGSRGGPDRTGWEIEVLSEGSSAVCKVASSVAVGACVAHLREAFSWATGGLHSIKVFR